MAVCLGCTSPPGLTVRLEVGSLYTPRTTGIYGNRIILRRSSSQHSLGPGFWSGRVGARVWEVVLTLKRSDRKGRGGTSFCRGKRRRKMKKKGNENNPEIFSSTGRPDFLVSWGMAGWSLISLVVSNSRRLRLFANKALISRIVE
nr:hypothetical protein Iba_chr01aCG5570 [Ipomoea batatas]